MIVILGHADDDDKRYVEDAAAVVLDPGGFVRICRDGKQDEDVPYGTTVCVVPSS